MYCVVPFEAIPNHRFSCVVPIDGGNTKLRFYMRYNEIATYWVVDISKDDEVVLSSLPLKPAQNILEQFSYLGIGSAYILPKSEAAKQWPEANDFSSEWVVWWGDTQ